MFSKIWEFIKAPFVWVRDQWVKFEDWFGSKVPWLKSKAVAMLGTVSMGALAAQEFVTQIPQSSVIKTERLAIISTALLATIWLVRRIGSR